MSELPLIQLILSYKISCIRGSSEIPLLSLHLMQFWSDVIFRLSCSDSCLPIYWLRWDVGDGPWTCHDRGLPCHELCHAAWQVSRMGHITSGEESPWTILRHIMSSWVESASARIMNIMACERKVPGPFLEAYYVTLRWVCDCISAPSLAHYVNLRPCQSLYVGWAAQIVKLGFKSRSLEKSDIPFYALSSFQVFLGDLPKVDNIF